MRRVKTLGLLSCLELKFRWSFGGEEKKTLGLLSYLELKFRWSSGGERENNPFPSFSLT